MAVTLISEAEAVRDFTAILARVHAGEEIVIESVASPDVSIRTALPLHRSIPESIARLETLTRREGLEAYMDADFARDLEALVSDRKPRDTSAWD